MKKYFSIALIVSLLLVIIAKIARRFVGLSPETNEILTIILFCLIGISFLMWATEALKNWAKAVFVLIGVYVIVSNFLEQTDLVVYTKIGLVILAFIVKRLIREKEGGIGHEDPSEIK